MEETVYQSEDSILARHPLATELLGQQRIIFEVSLNVVCLQCLTERETRRDICGCSRLRWVSLESVDRVELGEFCRSRECFSESASERGFKFTLMRVSRLQFDGE